MWILLLAVPVLSLESIHCSSISCSSGPTNGTCLSMISSKMISFQPCVQGLVCDTNFTNTYTPFVPTVMCTTGLPQTDLCNDITGLYTGLTCCVSSNCYSHQCTNSMCEGTAAGSRCNADEECLPGYYCNVVCLPYITSNCIRDNMCLAGYGCNSTNCVQFHTLSNGQAADRDIFCKTGYLYNGLCDAINAYVNGAQLDSGLVCTLGDTCSYYTTNKNILISSSPCLCSGVFGASTGYCGLYANKSMAVQSFYAALLYTTSTCTGVYAHTDDPDYLYTCESISENNYKYGKLMLQRYTYFNLYKSHGADHCARPFGLFDPWYDESTYSFIENLSFYCFLTILIIF